MPTILLINGPNLNLLGAREPERYGKETLDEVNLRLKHRAESSDHVLDAFQSNVEGDIISRIHQAKDDQVDIIIINAASLTHSSVGIRDALLGTAIPFIEVHISNVYQREAFRHHSYLSDIAIGVIVGLGTLGYDLALQAAIEHITN